MSRKTAAGEVVEAILKNPRPGKTFLGLVPLDASDEELERICDVLNGKVDAATPTPDQPWIRPKEKGSP